MKRKNIDYESLFILLFALLVGGAVRFYPLSLSDFPLNDGGLFYQMTRELLDQGFALPVFTAYNGGQIPFAYPPLAFYLMAAVQRFLRFEILDQLRYLPALISTLCIPAFYFLSRRITTSKPISAFAVLAFALMPRGYLWLGMGGGIARSLGMLFAILAILAVWETFSRFKLSALLFSIFFCSLTILSHPETAWFLFLTCLLIWIKLGLNKRGLLYAGITVLGVLLLTSPWWVTLLQRHGFAVLMAAAQTGGIFSIRIALFDFTLEPFATLLGVVALLGLFAELVRRRYFLPVWMLLIAVFIPRSGETFAILPGSMLFGSGMVGVLLPGLLSYRNNTVEDGPELSQMLGGKITKWMLVYMLILALFAAMVIPSLGYPETAALSPEDREAMAWASKNTEAGSEFIVLTGNDRGWGVDANSEWFPTLSGKNSLATIQGSEWLPDQEFEKQRDRYSLLQLCAKRDEACLFAWAKDHQAPFTYAYVVKPTEGDEVTYLPIYFSLLASDQFELIFDNPGASIFRVVETP